ncbi:hypothetical protein DTO166G4_6159 [Paecilomyces variotii]|nr:hypothetical protein DTO166G4_6159 [Paecilomyces variotii]KAJ9228826.1 hypothetical protein DTO166G5_8284 [Paecilomyces variotii]
MASIVNAFRKQKPQRAPLHARWGDVGITVPTEGSWSQFDNPHKANRERAGYGPGFVPDCNDENDPNLINQPSSKKSTTKRHQLSTPLSRMRSITRRKDQETKRSNGTSKARFSYKPIDPDHMVELAMEYGDGTEIPPILYVPPSKAYYEDLTVLQSRLRSKNPQVTTQHVPRDSWPRPPWDFLSDDDDRSTSTSSQTRILPYHQPASREVSDRKKKKDRKLFAPKPATFAMVEDDEDLYG